MRSSLKRFLFAVLAIGFMGLHQQTVQAGGFNLYEFGGRASALAGAVVAQSQDASTIFYNPAGLAFLDHNQFYGGTTIIMPKGGFVGADPIMGDTFHKNKAKVFTPIGMYYGHKLTDDLGIGIGITNPFGLGLEWDDDFPGRAISRKAEIVSFYISPVVAYKLTPNLSIGGGPDFVISQVNLIRNVNIFDSEGSAGYEVGDVELNGTSSLGIGFSAAIQYKMNDLSLGFTYRHSIDNEFDDGEADFTIFNASALSVPNAAAIAGNALTDQNVATQINFPSFLSVGAHYQLTDRLGAEADFLWFKWSRFESISLDFANANTPDQTIPFNYDDAWQLRFGTEYAMTDKLDLRAGYIYDTTPQPIESVSPLLPDDNRHDFGIGMGYDFGGFFMDAGYMLVHIGERSTIEDGVGKNHNGFDGTYNSLAHLYWASIGYSFK